MSLFCGCLVNLTIRNTTYSLNKGKELTSWLSFVVSFSHWYSGSGEVLDCIDS